MSSAIPDEFSTDRLLLRAWQRSDAARLLPILAANLEHLRHWIPERVYSAVPLHALEQRLDGYAADFAAQRAWRFALFPKQSSELMGEVSLFPRDRQARVHFAAADRVEIGYWLRKDATGKGYATEAAEALIRIASTLPGITGVEIRCDARNPASAAVAERLGFTLDDTAGGVSTDMIWRLHCATPASIP